MLLHPPHILPLLQCGVSYMGTVLQEQTSPVWVPLVPARSLTLSVLSTDCTYPCWCVGYSMDICSNVAHHELHGDSLLHHSPLHGLQGNFCCGIWSTSSTSFFTDLVVCCSHILLTACIAFYPSFPSLIPKAPLELMLDQDMPCCEATGAR